MVRGKGRGMKSAKRYLDEARQIVAKATHGHPGIALSELDVRTVAIMMHSLVMIDAAKMVNT
jgi:hypothetical protein